MAKITCDCALCRGLAEDGVTPLGLVLTPSGTGFFMFPMDYPPVYKFVMNGKFILSSGDFILTENKEFEEEP